MLCSFRDIVHRFQGIFIGCACNHIAVITIKAHLHIVLSKEIKINFVSCCADQPIHADTFCIFIAAAHEFTTKYRCKDRVNAMSEKHGTKLNMVLNRLIHISFEEVIPNFVCMFEYEPAPRSVDREDAHFLSRGFYEPGDLVGGECQEMIQWNHRLLRRRGKNRGVWLA